MEVDRNGLEILDRRTCLDLLQSRSVGRIGITSGALPAILPVTYRLIDDHIVFRTAPGSKLDSAVRNAVVVFEVDDVEPFSHEGWSVMVTGIARTVRPDGVREIAVDGIPRWAPLGVGDLVYVSLDLVDGRRISAAASAFARGAALR